MFMSTKIAEGLVVSKAGEYPSVPLVLPDPALATKLCHLRYQIEQLKGMPSIPDSLLAQLSSSFFELDCLLASAPPALHPLIQTDLLALIIGSPFARRCYEKPLGYAGDYGMVNMIADNAPAGDTCLDQRLHQVLLATPLAAAHRNRLVELERILKELASDFEEPGSCRVLNLGCGPIREVQSFIRNSPLCEGVHFTFMDFDAETLAYAENAFFTTANECGRRVQASFLKRSVTDIIRQSIKGQPLEQGGFHLIYCAGLFDYLKQGICQKLMDLFFDSVVEDGLVVATNVVTGCPGLCFIRIVLEWDLITRTLDECKELFPSLAAPEKCRVYTEPLGFNAFIEARR